MRVHPVQLRTAGSGWQIPVILLLLVTIFVSQLLNKDQPRADAVLNSASEVVVITTRNLRANEQLTIGAITIAERPVSTLPADAIGEIDDALGRYARGPIPAGYPLSAYLLTERAGNTASGKPLTPKRGKQQRKRPGTEA